MSNPEIIVVTTMNKSIYDLCGKRMIDTFLTYWPDEISLHVYCEGINIESGNKLRIIDFNEACPEFEEIERKYYFIVSKDYTLDVVRFAHKVFTISHAALTNPVEKIFWLDSDIITFGNISLDKVNSWLPDHVYTSCLKRKDMYTECSFVGYNIKNHIHANFMSLWKNLYHSGAILQLKQWHDCTTYDFTRTLLQVKTYNLSGEHKDKMHPFVYSELGQYMDHLKGPTRKRDGYSKEHPVHWWEINAPV